MKLCPDLLRLIASFLPSIQIYLLLLELGDFTNEWFWKEKLSKDYAGVNMEQGLKFTRTYAKLYQKYHQFWHGKKHKFIGVRRSSNPDYYFIDNSAYISNDILPPSSILTSGYPSTFSRWEKGKLFVYLEGKGWVRMKKIKLIEQYPLDLCQYSYGWKVKLNLTPYLEQIRSNQYMVNLEYFSEIRDRYFSFFYDWRGVKYGITYSVKFTHSLPEKWEIVEPTRGYYFYENEGQIKILY